jgi:hypothetical protein
MEFRAYLMNQLRIGNLSYAEKERAVPPVFLTQGNIQHTQMIQLLIQKILLLMGQILCIADAFHGFSYPSYVAPAKQRSAAALPAVPHVHPQSQKAVSFSSLTG